KMKEQAANLHRNRWQDAEHRKRAVHAEAQRKKAVIDEELKEKHADVDAFADRHAFFVGPEAAHHFATGHKQGLTLEAEAAKHKIEEKSLKRQAAHAESAHQTSRKINESVEGLHSQVGKDGQFGVRPQSSNLHVRHYGK
ncbi:MAG TPA: hypothetical protein V6C72_03025, partial [Chroococcales cyanobacterium]